LAIRFGHAAFPAIEQGQCGIDHFAHIGASGGYTIAQVPGMFDRGGKVGTHGNSPEFGILRGLSRPGAGGKRG
jgi:biotin transporter BioY